MPISVAIEGIQDSRADYSEQDWLRADAALREAVIAFYDSGATADNIREAIEGGLDDAGAEA